MEQRIQDKENEAALRQSRMKVQRWVPLLANTGVLFIGIAGILGIVLNSPLLMQWEITPSPTSMPIKLMLTFALMLLSTGYFFQALPKLRHWKYGQYVSLICFVLPLLIGLADIIDFIKAQPDVELSMFLIPKNPVLGNLPLFTNLGLLLASTISIVNLVSPPLNSQKAFWIVQVPAMLLLNLAAFGFVQNYTGILFFGYLITKPASFALLLYGFVLAFTYAQETPIFKGFFSASPKTRLYTTFVCLSWVLFVFWQTFNWNLAFAPSTDIVLINLQKNFILVEMLEIGFSSFLLLLGLNIVGTLEENALLIIKLREAFDSYTMLAATLSHDLKAPIQTEISAIEMILNGQFGGVLPEKSARMLEVVNESNRFELELVRNLVDLLRYEVHEVKFNPEPIQINALFAIVSEELMPLALAKAQTLRFHFYPKPGETILADPTALKRVIFNLVNNAIQYLEKGHHIDIEVKQREQDYLFLIRDDGPGISPQVQKRLFQRFSRGEGRSDVPSSSGLGLYVSKQIVTQHGGRIGLDSTVGKGSTFYFTLPRQPVIPILEKSPVALEGLFNHIRPL